MSTQTIVGVRFRDCGKVYYFSTSGIELTSGDGVIVETVKGTEFAKVTSNPTEMEDEQLTKPLKEIIRKATPADIEQLNKNKAKEQEAFEKCREKIIEHKLEMNLVDVDFGFTGSRITFYFTSDGRVDFRELVKDLAGMFHTRIELRQIGVRDEAKMIGGLGACGRPVCCASFLSDFQPVSIKMAKEQNLALSPPRISGICGRLMCCLKYEQVCYESMRKKMPAVSSEVITPDGNGIVWENNVLTEKTKVKITLSDGTPELREYPLSEIKFTKHTHIVAQSDDKDSELDAVIPPELEE